MEKKRCFLAVKAPSTNIYEQRLQQLDHDFDVKMSITKPENYHFTLHFFGDETIDGIEKIKSVCNQIQYHQFQLSLKEPGAIPQNKPSKVRVLHINPIKGSSELEKLVGVIRSKLLGGGFETPKRKYLPHMTVARIRHGRDKEKLYSSWISQEFDSLDFVVKKFVLVESELTPQGSIYSNLASFDLNR